MVFVMHKERKEKGLEDGKTPVSESIVDDLVGVYEYLSKNELYRDCLKSLEPYVKHSESTSGKKIENFEDVFSIIDMTSNVSSLESVRILGIGAKIACVSGRFDKESDFISRKALIFEEKQQDLANALKTEIDYCYGKSQYFESGIVFDHYINLLRLAIKLDSKEEINRCLSKMYTLTSSSVDSFPKVRKALKELSAVCDYDNLEQREVMQNVLEDCRIIFPELASSDKILLGIMAERWDCSEDF